jgi:hypothetical protein
MVEPCSLESFKGRKDIFDGYHHAQYALFGLKFSMSGGSCVDTLNRGQKVGQLSAMFGIRYLFFKLKSVKYNQLWSIYSCGVEARPSYRCTNRFEIVSSRYGSQLYFTVDPTDLLLK